MSGSISGKAFDLTDLIDYQPGSVVSRAIVQKEVGTITLFAFDKGQGLSEHTAPYDAFVQVIEGAAKVRISGKEHVVKAGQALVMPADRPHSVQAGERFKMMLIMIKAAPAKGAEE